MKRFLTIFPPAENVHLIKDVGMLPFMMHKTLGHEGTLASYNNGTYPYLDNEVKGLKHVIIKRTFNHQLLDVCLFLLFNFRKYDVLQVYHLKYNSLIWLGLFKLLKLNKGKTFLKLDADGSVLQFNPSSLKKIIAGWLLKNIALITVENKTYLQLLNEANTFGKVVKYCPNGFYDNGVRDDTSFTEKENIMITVGRIGTTQKASEILCEGFRIFALSDQNWKLEVIGTIEPDFQDFIRDYFLRYPELEPRVVFTGSIDDRTVMQAKFKRAKLFVLTSKWEGFPLVFPEAARAGCFIVSSDLPSAKDVVAGGKYGLLFQVDQVEELAKKLREATQDEEKLSAACLPIQDHGYQNFYWPEIAKKIAQEIF